MTLLDSRTRWLGPEQRTRLRLGARRHWVFLVVLAAGLVLRVITQVAYRPALFFVDSYQYLDNVHDLDITETHPLGYVLFLLRPVLSVGNLAVVAAVQHMLGLGMGIAIYALLMRLGVRRWIAVLATVPVLLDAYQLQIEQLIMSDVLFQALVLAAVVLLLWRRPLTLPILVIAGALFGLAMTVRVIGGVLLVPAVVFAMVAGPGGWDRLRRATVIALGFALPVVPYAAYYSVVSGTVGFNPRDARMLYGRAATIVDCRGLDMPDYERALCPDEPLDDRLGVNDYAFGPEIDRLELELPPGKNRETVLREFTRRVFLHQPLDLTKAVITDFGKGFVWARTTYPGDPSIDRWQFQRHFPTFGRDAEGAVRRFGGGGPAVIDPLAAFLRGYQLSIGYVPGTLVAIAFVLGLVGAAGIGRARRSGLRAACLLPALTGLLVLFAADVFGFSWRYQLPAMVLAPLAGALGVTAVTGWRSTSPEHAAPLAVTTGAPDSPPDAN
jgi:Dolichyl-phosphate-mannose-protein mannosyltransferase